MTERPRPIAWVYSGGYTFRWGHSEGLMTVHQGDYLNSRANVAIVERVPVDDWHDLAELRRRADQWLAQHARAHDGGKRGGHGLS